MKKLPNTAFVLFSSGAFGGAERRFTNLFLHFNSKYPDVFRFILNHKLQNHLIRVFKTLPEDRICIVGEPINNSAEAAGSVERSNSSPPDPMELNRRTSMPRKLYWYLKNKRRQKKIFKEIEKIRKENNIEVFIGVFSGVLPLVFFMNRKEKNPAVIFSNMDSWFSDVHSDMKKLWYRRYYSFNYAMENADAVDFLSPYIAEGIKQRNVNIPTERISVAPCSFADYSKYHIGKKENFEIAFSSRLEPGKNPILFLESAEEILSTHPMIKFHIMGEGTLAKEVEDFITSRGLEKNISFGFHPEPSEILAETSVFVSLQSGTNYPSQSILEAMACGNAIIASNKGDTNLFIKSDNGILVELTKDSVVSALKRLIENPEFTKKLGKEAYKTARENHTIEKMSEYYQNLILKVYAEKNG